MMSTREVAEYLGLNQKKVYALVKEHRIPCTRVTGKWLFPRAMVDRWIEDDIAGTHFPGEDGNVILAGSHDLSVELLSSELNRRFPDLILLSANLGSVGGLRALENGRSHLAGSHLLDSDTSEYNLPYLPRLLPDLETVVVCLVHREQGLIVQPGNPLDVRGLENLAGPHMRFVNRQQGAGTRVLLDHHLARLGISPAHVRGYDEEVATHTEVAAAIRGGRADAGLGIHAAALAFGLDFVPVARERFDLIVPRSFFYTETMQKVLEVIRSGSFAEAVVRMGGYDVHGSGEVLSWR